MSTEAKGIVMRYFRAFCFLMSLFALCAAGKPSRGVRGSYEASTASAQANAKPLIVLDAGHGGSDEGTKMSRILEKKLALTTTLMTKQHLEELGYRVILTRSRDVYLPLPKRVSIANKTKGALFVSVHFNSSPSAQAKGIEIFYYESKEKWRSKASQRLANCILYRVIDQTDANSRGVKHGNFHVIRETEMPAVLVEGGFVTNEKERAKLRDHAYLDRIAIGIAEGVDKYMKM